MFTRGEDYVAGSVQDVQTAVLDCAASQCGLMPVGGRTKVHIGHESTKPLRTLSLSPLNSIVDYTPADLVVVADAGMTLDSLQTELGQNGQWLPIECSLSGRQTLGGIVATRANSQIRAGFGSVRDWLIGVEVVDSLGRVVVGGGKVVKNVAGYDLPKLYCGSWGTLGAITKTSFKVAALPEADRSLLIVLSTDRNSEELLDLLFSHLTPSSTILFNAASAALLLGENAAPAQYLFVRCIGIREDVDVRIERIQTAAAPFAASIIDLPPALAMKLAALLRDFDREPSPLSARYHILSSQVGAYVRMVEWIAARSNFRAHVIADASCGIVQAQFHPVSDFADWNAFLPLFQDKAQRVGGSLIIERMPNEWRTVDVPVWSPMLPDHRIMKLIKRSLDPANLFNPGRFIGGI